MGLRTQACTPEDAEAGKAKAKEETLEGAEKQRMSGDEKPDEGQCDVEFGDGRLFNEDVQGEMTEACVPKPTVAAMKFE
jgi:hypothetical protein